MAACRASFLHLCSGIRVDHTGFQQDLLEQLDRVLLGPLLVHLLRHVVGRIVLGVAVHPHGDALDDRRSVAGPGPGHTFGDRVVHGEHIGAVHGDAGNAVGDLALSENFSEFDCMRIGVE